MPDNIDFTVKWIGWDGMGIEEETISKYDLTAAIKWAANKVVAKKDAHGFFVTRDRTK